MEKIINVKTNTEEVLKELDKIYGIEECKWEILNYIKYLEISKQNKFANYNIIIHNQSDYPSETKELLVEYICKRLRKNAIIKKGYKYIDYNQLKKFEKDDDIDNKLDNKTLDLEDDLIIIDSDKLNRRLESCRDGIISLLNKYKNKIFIIIDNSFLAGSVNTSFNKYFDWYFEINKISNENKKDYLENALNKHDIKIEANCDYISNLISEPFYLVKSKLPHIILECKMNKIDKINDEVFKKYFKKENNNKNESSKNKENTLKNELNLEALIGMDNIKQEINKIVNYVKICKKRKGKLPMLHMCFTGNPGTGKTTIARIIGDIFKNEKILSKGKFVEVHGRDLVGKYVGWTAKEVHDYIQKAKGGILFIDEAYSLNSDRHGSFEDEAIATLIKEMEDNRDDLCVILAGYKDEMSELIKRNPGFESRIQFYIDFPDYKCDELYEIFRRLAKKENYKISNQVKNILVESFGIFINTKTFANGRFVRNLYEKVKIEQANRVSLNKKENINLIKKCDIENVLKNIKPAEENKVKIGFAS